MRTKRIKILTTLTLLVMVSFWVGSRYPGLSVKAEVGPDMILDGLGFDVVMPVEVGDSVPVQIGKRTVNWMKTNLKGMIFGLIIAAAFQTLLALLSRKTFRSPLANALLGVSVGAPMGLCVNCAAPISGGLYKGGGRVETSLAAMLASPTLNVVVLSFLLTMLPWHLAMLKIAATLLLLLVVVPWFGSKWERPEAECPPEEALCEEESWSQAFLGSMKDFVGNLGRLMVQLVPAMALAGFLGSVMVTVVPFQELARFSRPGLIALAGIALLGTFFPVPIAFDVITCALLYTAGMPVEVVAVLLFTLGSYSIYSFSVVGQTISPRLAVKLYAAVTLLGILVGLAAGPLDRIYRKNTDAQLLEALEGTSFERRDRPSDPAAQTLAEINDDLAKHTLKWQTVSSTAQMKIEKRPWQPLSQPADTLFTPEPGEKRGLSLPIVLGYMEHFTIPTLSNRTLAAGDIHQDGWTDIVAANDVEVGGLALFANIGGQFERQELDLGEYDQDFVPVCALVDLNSDDRLDLYFSTINGDHGYLLNSQGSFGPPQMLPKLPGAFVNAVGFADIDRDGDLDIALGTWVHRFFRTQHFRGWNYLAIQNDQHQFELTPLPGNGGNCHAVLISDLDNDGLQDLFFAHDSRPEDEFYKGNGTAHPQQQGAETFPRSTQWTMSLDSADLNNDLQLSLFADNIAYDTDERGRHTMAQKQDRASLLPPREREAVEYMIATDDLHDRIRRGAAPEAVLRAPELSEQDRAEVLFDAIISRYWRGDERATWEDKVAGFPPHMRHLFDRVFPQPNAVAPPRSDSPAVAPIPSSKGANTLLEWNGSQWVDRAKEWGLQFTYWSWNAKFADLDLDGFQDLFLVNGSYQEPLLNPNLLFLNRSGEKMERVDDQGTQDYFPTANYVYVDLDNDGDLDIVLSPQNGPMRCLINNRQENASIGFVLNDPGHSVVGVRIIVRYEGGQQ
ncbi:MAG: VCBS repeat-containing protein, partial [Candidatus Eremiobacteraeota bacterium]|nr:VCBS repeat-containing protein [Candidatus Eremiobacteraeota bacterium]